MPALRVGIDFRRKSMRGRDEAEAETPAFNGESGAQVRHHAIAARPPAPTFADFTMPVDIRRWRRNVSHSTTLLLDDAGPLCTVSALPEPTS